VRAPVPSALAGERIDRVVSLLTGVSRSTAAGLVDAGGVRVDGRAVHSRSRRVCEGEVVEVDLPREVAASEAVADPAVAVPIVYSDEEVIVVDKPAGLVVHEGAGTRAGTLVHGLLARFPDLAGVGDTTRPGIVHRLDAGTSGLLVVARTAAAYHSLVGQLGARSVERRYLALVLGHVEPGAGVVEAPIGRAGGDPTRMAVSLRGRQARTRYEVRERFDGPVPCSLLECRLETGRTHQIRVHLAAIGHPVAGDARYRGDRPALPLRRPFLHAHRLAFDHPASGDRLAFSSPLPADLEEVRRGLR
jgi:23S rRNA pseudouridine1911/1915/1917 synthase